LKNAIREVSKDVRGKNIDGIPRAIGGTTAMIGIAMFGNTLRTGGKNLEDIESGEKDIGDEIKDAAIRTGLLGPTEQLYRTQKGLEYDNLIRSILQRFTGPAVDDILRLFDDWTGPLSFAVDEAPGIAALRSLDPEGYKAIKKAAKDVDDALSFTRAKKPKVEKPVENIPLFATGGLVEGPDVVPYTKEDPADRVDPFTGSPYSEQMDRLGFKKGGYVIQKGDTLWSLSKKFGVSIDELLNANKNIEDRNIIFAGQELNVPTKTKQEDKKVNNIPAEDYKKLQNIKKQYQERGQESSSDNLVNVKAEVAKQKLQQVTSKNEKPAQRERLLPINARQFIYDIFGGDEDLTEQALDADELTALKDVVKRAKTRGSRIIEYKDYGTTEEGKQYMDVGGVGSGAVDVIKRSFENPSYALKTTIGQANFYEDSDGNTIIEDQYNFNDADTKRDFNTFVNDMKTIIKNPLDYAGLRKIGTYLGSGSGSGSKVKINLGKL